MSLGGSTTSTTELPAWAEDYMKMVMAQAEKASSIGYAPYIGPDVAAITPMQQAAFDNTNSAAGAYGMATAPTTGMPQTVTSSNGVTGYSSAPIYNDALAQLKATNPQQYAALMAYSGGGTVPAPVPPPVNKTQPAPVPATTTNSSNGSSFAKMGGMF